MKGMALEFVFKMFIYIVVVLVVIGIILQFRSEIISALNLCKYVPGGCPEKEECKTIHSTEPSITETTLNKYCDLCWSKTGARGYTKDCICYIITGSFSPFSYSNEHCELKCNIQATSLIITYNHLLKKILIEC